MVSPQATLIINMRKYENESGYDPETSFIDQKPIINHCRYFNRTMFGASVGLLVQLDSIHTDKTLLELSKYLSGTEVHKLLFVHKRTIRRVLNSDRT